MIGRTTPTVLNNMSAPADYKRCHLRSIVERVLHFRLEREVLVLGSHVTALAEKH